MVIIGTFYRYCHGEYHRQQDAADDGASGADKGGDSDNTIEIVVVVLLQMGPKV